MAGDGNLFSLFDEANFIESSNTTNITGDTVDDKVNKFLTQIPVLKDEDEEQEEVEDQEESESLDQEESEEQESEEQEDLQEDSHAEEEEDSEEVSTFELFAGMLIEDGVLIPKTDEEGNPLEDVYSADQEGLRLMVEHTVEQRVEEVKEELNSLVINETLNATLGDLVDYIKNGGDPKEFFDTTINEDYSDIELDDEDNQELLIREKASYDGLDDEDIDELVEEYKVNGTLAKHAKIAHKTLLKIQQSKFEELKQNQEIARVEREKESLKIQEEFKNKIFSLNQVSSFNLSQRDKEKFYEYLTKPVKKTSSGETLTQFELDNTEDKRLQMAFISFKGGLEAVEKKATTKTSQELKMALSKSKDSMLSRNSQADESQDTEFKKKKSDKIFVPTPDFFKIS